MIDHVQQCTQMVPNTHRFHHQCAPPPLCLAVPSVLLWASGNRKGIDSAYDEMWSGVSLKQVLRQGPSLQVGSCSDFRSTLPGYELVRLDATTLSDRPVVRLRRLGPVQFYSRGLAISDACKKPPVTRQEQAGSNGWLNQFCSGRRLVPIDADILSPRRRVSRDHRFDDIGITRHHDGPDRSTMAVSASRTSMDTSAAGASALR